MTDCKTIFELLGDSRKVHLAQIKLAPSYFPIASRSFSTLLGTGRRALRLRSSTTCGAQPSRASRGPGRAKRGPAARSAAGAARRPAPPGAPELREGRQGKLEATKLEANKRGANQHLWEAGKRALHVRDLLSAFANFRTITRTLINTSSPPRE